MRRNGGNTLAWERLGRVQHPCGDANIDSAAISNKPSSSSAAHLDGREALARECLGRVEGLQEDANVRVALLLALVVERPHDDLVVARAEAISALQMRWTLMTAAFTCIDTLAFLGLAGNASCKQF